jgi:hypothetical protein
MCPLQAGHPVYSEGDALRWALQIALALEYLHSHEPKVGSLHPVLGWWEISIVGWIGVGMGRGFLRRRLPLKGQRQAAHPTRTYRCTTLACMAATPPCFPG